MTRRTSAPAIEQFVPALLGALRLGINLVGRPKVVGFLAKYLAQLISRWVGPQLSGPLSNAIVDTGLRLVTLESREMASAQRRGRPGRARQRHRGHRAPPRRERGLCLRGRGPDAARRRRGVQRGGRHALPAAIRPAGACSRRLRSAAPSSPAGRAASGPTASTAGCPRSRSRRRSPTRCRPSAGRRSARSCAPPARRSRSRRGCTSISRPPGTTVPRMMRIGPRPRGGGRGYVARPTSIR